MKKLRELMKLHGLEPWQIISILGCNSQQFCRWSKDGSVPSRKYRIKIEDLVKRLGAKNSFIDSTNQLQR